jgi:predicted N-acetyltransferase YhbS
VGDGFVFKYVETDEDVEQYLLLMRRVFGEDTGVDSLVKKLVDHHPGMTLNDFFVMKLDGDVVAGLGLIPVTWVIGEIPLKVAEMGFVATLPEFRGKGLIRRLVGEFHGKVEDEEYDLAVVEGIPYFYRQFGYEYAIPLLEETSIRMGQIPDYDATHEIRRFTGMDITQASRLLSTAQEKFYVHSVRDEYVWGIQEKTRVASDPEPFESYIVEEGGVSIAYFRFREDRKESQLVLTEVTDVDQVVAEAVLRFLKEMGLKRGLQVLSARVSYEEPFAQHLETLGGVKRLPPYAWQVRVTDYVRMFQKLRPLFEARLANSACRRLTEKLAFNFRRFIIQLQVENGSITDVRRLETGERSSLGLNPSTFTQLLLGYRSRCELEMCFPDFRIDVAHRRLLDVLFPKLPSYIHSAY